MKVYHGTAEQFPVKELRGGPDTAGLMGKPMPALWLTENPELAANYASWSADCTKGKHLRVICLEMDRECPRLRRLRNKKVQRTRHENRK